MKDENAEPPSGWKNQTCNGNPEVDLAPDTGELEDAIEVLRANDAPACANAVEQALAAILQAKAIADAEAALWAGVEAEWRTPKNDLTAYMMRSAAKARRETAEKIAAEIRKIAKRSTPNDEAGIVPASPQSTSNDE